MAGWWTIISTDTPGKMAACLPSQLLTIEVWDQS